MQKSHLRSLLEHLDANPDSMINYVRGSVYVYGLNTSAYDISWTLSKN